MADVEKGYVLIVDFADNGGKPFGSRRYDLVQDDPDLVGAVVTSMITKIRAATDAVVAGWTLGRKTINDALTLPAAGVQNENQLIWTAPVVGDPTKSAYLTIPAAKIGLFTNTSGKGANVANIGSAALAAYVGMFDPTVGNEAYISDGEQIVSLSGSGKRRHTKNNNG